MTTPTELQNEIETLSDKTFVASKEFMKSLFYYLPPIKAIPLLEKFNLPKPDHLAILHVEIMKETLDEAAVNLNMTLDTLKRRRNRGYDAIVRSMP